MALSSDYVTISQAADYCGVDRGTIARWIRERQVGYQRLGREVIIPKAQVDLLKDVRTLEDVIREAARGAGLPIDDRVQVRMNTIVMANQGRNVLELYVPHGTRAWAVRITATPVE